MRMKEAERWKDKESNNENNKQRKNDAEELNNKE
jgi:hypothetical protein